MEGFSQGGGVGLMSARWMIEGETERNTMAMDVAQFGDWINTEHMLPKVIENYQKRFFYFLPERSTSDSSSPAHDSNV